ncbi:MAG TPA: bifunctional 5,10-methylenetetrahydrofolate dehydrogenase/5,10-methenyltetrahydrofolate cyclohydrolase [Candidatus Omnitrophota bacterium]|nr:bifunctional 5,10-methylenetetrahydrofolate dehydrogenase/5,10-methenyltetrahydrofolate cyclohydrolase [Candidatus Omnitrophota bacterium]HPD85027.1 bifunctional 5,10-methylenetetrahydrofolate dehydrogenase/5,10-methenyltetrahydrofolate cyclohydrolase [Candidatus Omnitrophota bacterium]HRZ03885.1 bifunctional 5,10-methylenetetrahydrofolate dehydrogenase/5,10-methenyltetrahydrofolate cyclohydrolase [Candidatus Omnitrophota bacterium]
MTARLLDGKLLAESVKQNLKKEVDALRQKTGLVPRLANILVGDDAAAKTYANSQKKVAQDIGIDYGLINLPEDISQKKLIESIEELNRDPGTHGIMIYQPLPAHVDYRLVAECVDTAKDIEGMKPANLGKMLLGGAKIIPATPAAVMEHIKSTGVKLRGKEAVIVGRSEIVGKPLILLLLEQSATVTVCHTGTVEAGLLTEHIARADILIVAVGKAGLVKGEWIKENAVVIDVGINRIGKTIVGDVDFESASQKASYITPVPGGVGPLTVVMLMKNTIEAFKLQVKG